MTRRSDNGWTLLEMLAVIFVVGVIMSLTLPTIRQIRNAAYDAGSLSNLRQHSAIFRSYANDYDDMYPYVTKPEWCRDWVRYGSMHVQTNYFGAATVWSIALADHCYDDDYFSKSFHPPHIVEQTDARTLSLHSEYFYSSTFLAGPEFWRYETRSGPGQWRPVRGSEVIHPSKKSLHWQSTPGELASVREIHLFGLVDGSVQSIAYREVLSQYSAGTSGFWSEQGCAHATYGQPGMHTIGGVHGRDMQ